MLHFILNKYLTKGELSLELQLPASKSMKLLDLTSDKTVTKLTWTVLSLAALKVFVGAVRYYSSRKRVSQFFAKYPELFKGNLVLYCTHSYFQITGWAGWPNCIKTKLGRLKKQNHNN